MKFEHVVTLARETPIEALSDACGLQEVEALRIQHGKRPLTIREAGALAELHGLKLQDVLAI
jgi:single-strand DNA-binding protein